MDDSLYDEFGNFIGNPDSDDEELSNKEINDNEEDSKAYESTSSIDENEMDVDAEETSTAVVLHEDKQYYPSAIDVFGADVEAVTHEEDAQPLSEPIIAPIKVKKFLIENFDLPEVNFSREFMSDSLNVPEHVRNVALVGGLHHGTTSILDMLVQETHPQVKDLTGRRQDEQIRYTDTHFLERQRGLTIKCAPMSIPLQTTKGKTHLINILDTPGHSNFVDEVACGLRLSDGIALVVDVIEGITPSSRQVIRQAVLEKLSIVLVINKIDRLILELKLPPADAYLKLKYCIEEVNQILNSFAPTLNSLRLSPEKGNVVFASAKLGFAFTLESFASMYSALHGTVSASDLSSRLWGEIYYNSSTNKFTKKSLTSDTKNAFVAFVLEPVYKLFSSVISDSSSELKSTLEGLGIYLRPSDYKLDAKPLLKLVCSHFFGNATGLIDAFVNHILSPVESAKQKIETTYSGPLDTTIAKSLLTCDQNGPVVVHITKLYSSQDASEFYSFGRVLSGTLKIGQEIKVLGEGYSLEDEEDMAYASVKDLWIYESRYKIPVSGVPAGNWVLIGGIDMSIVKTATVVSKDLKDDVFIFKPINHLTESVFKVAVEPVNPSELPKMLDGLRKVNKSFPLLQTKVEESGEHIILGTGELYIDTVLHDLRRAYSDMEIKVSDPVTRFCETVIDQSAIKCYAETPNKKNKISIIAEPLESGIAEDIESGAVNIHWPVRQIGQFFQNKYDWDILAARSIWTFGPDDTGPNILQDDTITGEVDKKLLFSIRDSIKQGFQWSVREGPLCEEPIRNTRFRIMDVTLTSEAIYRGGGQIIPTARRVCYSSFLTASPRLMEPLYSVHVIGPAECVSVLYSILQKRRGYVLKESPIHGTPLYSIEGSIPVIDSFGFETDLRVATKGRATCSLVFEKWQVVPGDPLDKEIIVPPLQAAVGQALARDFVLKTRRRKGLSEEPTITKYIDQTIDSSILGAV
ncbi:P-loop containing nucleoside triphosphate hydrolase protein [Lipomyces japonicus]|uniref:P-loop containing nucleoside triphosphate hydrolase protein n=1 Tax=Lipomyces japonicus TaxID=56871 RepID=UPI0034CE1ADF